MLYCWDQQLSAVIAFVCIQFSIGDVKQNEGNRQYGATIKLFQLGQIVGSVTEALEQFRGDEVPEDDMSLVVIKVDQ